MIKKKPANQIFFFTKHPFHLIDPSPWPLLMAIGIFIITIGLVTWMQQIVNSTKLLTTGFIIAIYVLSLWWRDVIREATFEDQHKISVRRGLRLGVILFIVSEIMFFLAFFWGFFHSSLSPVYNIGSVWPPKSVDIVALNGIPLTNTFLLLSSGATVTWGHQALTSRAKKHTITALTLTISLALLFTLLQSLEYANAPFNISDGIFGSCFYLTTGFHGFHVLIGTAALTVALIRVTLNHFTSTQLLGFEAAIWYWHFVDVVWLFLLASVYWWGQ